MFGIQNYGSFVMAVILFQLFPGAGTVAILNATAQGGVSTGMKAVFGTLVGDFIYMLAAALGLAAILNSYPSILAVAQWFGVAYLCWVGVKFLRVSFTNQSADKKWEQESWAYFRQAIAVSLTNPKAIMFFMAFFPLFLSVDSKPLTLAMLIAHVTVISLIYQTGLVLVGNSIVQRISQLQYVRLIATRLAGVVIIGFGVKLFLNNR
ncbi:MAG: LysE family translocator [Desulfobacteraceae bacterium]|nr:LysE family translocator [Desulfobacteraceae bacterium]